MSEEQLRNLQRDLQKKISKARPVYEKFEKKELVNLTEEEQRLVTNYPRWLEDLECVKKGEMPAKRTTTSAATATNNNQADDDDEQQQEQQQEEVEVEEEVVVADEDQEEEENNNQDDNDQQQEQEQAQNDDQQDDDDDQQKAWADLTHRQLVRRLQRSTKSVRKAQIEAFVTRNVDSSKALALYKRFESARASKASPADIESIKKELTQEQNLVRVESDKLRNSLMNDIAKIEKDLAAQAEAAAAEQRRQQQAANVAKREQKKKAQAQRKEQEELEKAREAKRLLQEAEQKQKEHAFETNDTNQQEEVNAFDADNDFCVQADPVTIEQDQKRLQEEAEAEAEKKRQQEQQEEEAAKQAEKEKEEEERKKQKEQQDEEEAKKRKSAQEEQERQRLRREEEEKAAALKRKQEQEEAEQQQQQREKAAQEEEEEAARKKKAQQQQQKSILESSSDEISDDSEDDQEEAAPAPAEEDDDDGFFGGGADMFDLENVEKQQRKEEKAKRRAEKAERKAKREELRAAIARGEDPFSAAAKDEEESNTPTQQEQIKQPPKEIDWSVIAIEKNARRFMKKSNSKQENDATPNNSNSVASSPVTAAASSSTNNFGGSISTSPTATRPRHWVLSTETMSRASRASPTTAAKNNNKHHLAARINSELEACLEILPENVSIYEASYNNNNNNNNTTPSAVWRINVAPHDGALAGHVIPLSLTFTPYFPFEAPILQTLVEMPIHPLVASVNATQAEFKNCVEYDRQNDGSSSVRPRSTSRARMNSATRGGRGSGGKQSSSNKTSSPTNTNGASSSTRSGRTVAARNVSPAVGSSQKINNSKTTMIDDATLRSILTPRWSPLSSVNSIIFCVSKLFDAKFLPSSLLGNNKNSSSNTRLTLTCDALRNFFAMNPENANTVGVPQVYNGPWRNPTASSSSSSKKQQQQKSDEKEERSDENNNILVWDHRYGSGKHTVAIDWRDPTSTPNLTVGVQILDGKHFENVVDTCCVNLLTGEEKEFGSLNKKKNKKAMNVNGPVLISIQVDGGNETGVSGGESATISFSSPGSPSFKITSKFSGSSSSSLIAVAPFIINNEDPESENHIIQASFSVPHNFNQQQQHLDDLSALQSKDSKNKIAGGGKQQKAFFRDQTVGLVSASSFCAVTGVSFNSSSSSPIVLGVGVELSRNATTGLLTSTRSSCQTISNSIFPRIVGLRDANGLRMDAFMPLLFFDAGKNKEAKQNTVTALKTAIMNISRKPSATSASTLQSGTVALYTPPFVPTVAARTCALLLDGCVSDLMMILANMSSPTSSSSISTTTTSLLSSSSSSTTANSNKNNLFLAESVVTRYIALVYNFAVLAQEYPQMQEFATKTVNEWDASSASSASSSSSNIQNTCGHPFAFATITSNVTWQSATRKALETALSVGYTKISKLGAARQDSLPTSTSGESEVFTFLSSTASPLIFKHVLLASSLAAPFCKMPLSNLLSSLFTDAKEVAKVRTQMMTGIQNVQNGNVSSWGAMDEHFGVLLRVGDIVSSL